MSFLQRFTADASNACNDVYSNWILGDDAGKSAKLTLVLRPKPSLVQQMMQMNSNNGPPTTTTTMMAAAPNNHNGAAGGALMNGSGAAGATSSPPHAQQQQRLLQQQQQQQSSPPSQSQQQQQQQRRAGGRLMSLDLGMTFLEINGRAYVKTVAPCSAAARAGILPQDAVQYATLFQPDWIPLMVEKSRQERQQQQAAAGDNNNNRGDDNDDDIMATFDPATDEITTEMETQLAAQFVLDLEAKGMRISYDELRQLLGEGSLDPAATLQAFLSPPVAAKQQQQQQQQQHTRSVSSWATNGPPIPSTVNICVPPSPQQQQHQQQQNSITPQQQQHHDAAIANGGDPQQQQATSSSIAGTDDQQQQPLLRPVVFVFRRTRQRKISSFHHMGMPSFRLDDECDIASSLVRRLAPTADMDLPPPDTWEELVHDGTDWLLGSGSILPPKLGGGMNPASNNNANTTVTPQQQQTTTSSTSYQQQQGSAMNHGAGTPQQQQQQQHGVVGHSTRARSEDEDDVVAIPLDDFERERARKIAGLRSRMAAESIQFRGHVMGGGSSDDVESATIRGMIQKAVGLAFVRASKIVLGISIHGGSGVVIARLSDGTWSAPSAIGTMGLGLGLQFGLEVAEYIFILQTEEAMEHFRKGGSFTIGGNIGAAVAGLGREAYGAASVGGVCGTTSAVKDDEYNDNDSRDVHNRHGGGGGGAFMANQAAQSIAIAPIVAYAKSSGLYVGVSLEGSRIFARDDINSRTYKFASGRDVSSRDILSGKVPTPPEAEELYAALHSVEFTHEMSCLPRPPEVLRKDSTNAWYYDRSTLGGSGNNPSSPAGSPHSASSGPAGRGAGSSGAAANNNNNNISEPFTFLKSLDQTEAGECEAFELQFKKFMYGGVSVQRLLTDTEGRRSGRTGKERRTLWLMLPEVGSLRLGFVSKLSDGDGAVSNKSSTQRARKDDVSSRLSGLDGDLGTVGSEELTLDSALNTKDGGSTIGHIRTGNVQLSNKHSFALTDVTVVSQEPLVPVRFRGEDKMEHLRVISIQDVSGTSLLFLANNFREAELLVCGLKLLLERETARLGVRGGLPLTAFGGRNLEGAMSPSAARGFRDMPQTNMPSSSLNRTRKHNNPNNRSPGSGYASSDVGEDLSEHDPLERNLPNGRRTWGSVPGRDYMRGQAAAFTESHGAAGYSEQGVPTYVHGQTMIRDMAKNVRLPLPLPLCRVLLLDSTSPAIRKWEKDRGDKNFAKSRWAFPPATPRELENHASEHQLIASGSMNGAHRTTSFDRPRYGSLVRLSETHTVEADDPKKLAFTVTERNPRRGFSIKVRILLRAYKENSCDATVMAEVRPVGKDMSNQAAVHKAFLLVMDEIRQRYGSDGNGLLSGFLSVVDNMAEGSNKADSPNSKSRSFPHMSLDIEEKKTDHVVAATKKDSGNDSGLVSFEDMLKTGRQSPETIPVDRPSTPSLTHQIPEPDPAKRLNARPSGIPEDEDFVAKGEEIQSMSNSRKEAVLIEVKPLPKIRLSLMPAPREEDEDENSSSASPIPSKPLKKKKKSSTRLKKSPGTSWRKSSRQGR